MRSPETVGRSIMVVVLGLALLAAVLLTPIKGWLNQIPHLWEVLYPLLALFAAYLVVRTAAAREGWISILKWGVFCLSALSASLYVLADVSRTFFTLGRWGAIVFIIVEVIHTVAQDVFGVGERQTA
jgi:hypothetical protein